MLEATFFLSSEEERGRHAVGRRYRNFPELELETSTDWLEPFRKGYISQETFDPPLLEVLWLLYSVEIIFETPALGEKKDIFKNIS